MNFYSNNSLSNFSYPSRAFENLSDLRDFPSFSSRSLSLSLNRFVIKSAISCVDFLIEHSNLCVLSLGLCSTLGFPSVLSYFLQPHCLLQSYCPPQSHYPPQSHCLLQFSHRLSHSQHSCSERFTPASTIARSIRL